MTAWETILVAFGGNAALLLILGWLARSMGSQLLAKDLEKFKADLTATSTAAQEHLKHSLQMTALEHQVRFSKLHERRAEVVATAYDLLVEAHWAASSFAAVMEMAGEPPKEEKYVTAMNKAAEFYRYFDKNRIFLPQELCIQLETWIGEMRKQVIAFGVHLHKPENHMPDRMIEKKYEAWIKVGEYFEKEAPQARAALEGELRAIIGAP